MSKICYKCGVEEPEYRVVGYRRNCNECGGRNSVLEITEMVDLVNDLYLRGLLPEQLVEDNIDEEFVTPELDFDQDIFRAEIDAYNDYLEDDEL